MTASDRRHNDAIVSPQYYKDTMTQSSLHSTTKTQRRNRLSTVLQRHNDAIVSPQYYKDTTTQSSLHSTTIQWHAH